MFDTDGDVANRYTYEPFGNIFAAETTETAENAFTFTGQWYDEEIGQYYLRARMYDPQLYRFTARDPCQGDFTEPLSLHVYLYCLNGPINNIDPTGETTAYTLAAPVIAGYATHALAITVAAYGVANVDWGYIDLGITIDANLHRIMAMAAIGITPLSAINTILHEKRGRRQKEWEQDKEFFEWVNHVERQGRGDEPPEGPWWKHFVWMVSEVCKIFYKGD